MTFDYDAVITGGGLAGLTLARQLQLEAPHVRVLVLEKRSHPVPEAAFKVGESSVEIGAHYFNSVLRLQEHLQAQHLPKLGIRYFFPQGDNRDISRRVEVGPVEFPPVPSFQLDRGRLENALLVMLREAGVEVIDGCSVREIALNGSGHEVTFKDNAGTRTVRTRYVADASGRAGLIRRQLGLTKCVTHLANAGWFRIRTRVRVDDWADGPTWRDRVPSGGRWLSTNHLMGRGYWVWLIPLGSGSTSIGLVADASMHPFQGLNRFERAMEWLERYEPQCAGIVRGVEDRREDFLALRHYAYGSERVFSPDRWSLVGEAALFTDPFYSPGSDFIAIGCDCTADLITRAAAGEDIVDRAGAYNTMYLRLYDAFLRLYDGQYRLMGNAQVMTAKAAWDNACYWAITGLLYFQRRYRRPEFLQTVEPLMRRFFVLHARMQQFFHAWDLADSASYEDAFTNVNFIESLDRLQACLAAPQMDDETLRATLFSNFAFLERFAQTWQAYAAAIYAGLARFVPPGDGGLVDISALTLRRSRASAA